MHKPAHNQNPPNHTPYHPCAHQVCTVAGRRALSPAGMLQKHAGTGWQHATPTPHVHRPLWMCWRLPRRVWQCVAGPCDAVQSPAPAPFPALPIGVSFCCHPLALSTPPRRPPATRRSATLRHARTAGPTNWQSDPFSDQLGPTNWVPPIGSNFLDGPPTCTAGATVGGGAKHTPATKALAKVQWPQPFTASPSAP